ncbi:MAG: Tyrosine recombinase XerD [Ignavibacteriaceae bacterium]|nr:Tyrosine recombinase XerD [Ignavibacteriaceae bacterium]
MNKIDLSKMIPKFLKFLESVESASVHTIKSYRVDLFQAFGALDKVPNLNENDLLRKAREAQTKWGPLSPASRNRKTATLKSFFHYLEKEKLITRPLAELISSIKVPRKLPRSISVDEALAVIHVLKDEATHRDLLLFLLLYGGGLRVSEACELKWTQIDTSQKVLRIKGKGNKERLISLPKLVFDALELQRQNLPTTKNYIWGNEPMNPRTAYEIIRRSGTQAGLIRPIHPHALRHSFATHLLSSGANLRTLQELLGHQSLQATEKYTHLGIQELARTMQKHHPLSKPK